MSNRYARCAVCGKVVPIHKRKSADGPTYLRTHQDGLGNKCDGMLVPAIDEYTNMRRDRNIATEPEVLEFIVQYKIAHDGNSPSIRTIRAGVGANSTSSVYIVLVALTEAGLIRMSRNKTTKQIEIVGGRWVPPKWASNAGEARDLDALDLQRRSDRRSLPEVQKEIAALRTVRAVYALPSRFRFELNSEVLAAQINVLSFGHTLAEVESEFGGIGDVYVQATLASAWLYAEQEEAPSLGWLAFMDEVKAYQDKKGGHNAV